GFPVRVALTSEAHGQLDPKDRAYSPRHSLRRSTMGNLTARLQVTNCARRSSELRATCLRQTITMTVIVLGLLSAVSSGQVEGPVPDNSFGLHINDGFANLPPKNAGFTGFEAFRVLANGNGTRMQWARS